jgi:phosphinothricin acetyltransferase
MPDSAVAIDLAEEGELEAILALSNWGAESTPANFATEPESIADWVDAWRKTSPSYPWLVARRDGRVLGFAKASPHRARGAYRYTAEVSVYVDPALHGGGIGKLLYRHLVPTLRRQGYVTLLAGVTPPNDASERLHAALGFRRCGTYHRAGWKFGKWHDVGYWEIQLWPDHVPPDVIRPVAEAWPRVRDCLNGTTKVTVQRAALDVEPAPTLISALNAELAAMYAEPGANHFTLGASQVVPGRGAFFIARAGVEAVGCGAVRAIDESAVELKRMFVVPEWRGLGFSKVIVDELEREAARIGVKRVCLETGTRQVAAIALYEKAGYRRIPLFGEYVDSPLTSICMEKILV